MQRLTINNLNELEKVLDNCDKQLGNKVREFRNSQRQREENLGKSSLTHSLTLQSFFQFYCSLSYFTQCFPLSHLIEQQILILNNKALLGLREGVHEKH